MAEKAGVQVAEAGAQGVEAMGENLLGKVAETEEANLGKTLETEASNAEGFQNLLGKTEGDVDRSAEGINPQAGGARPENPGGEVPKAGGGDPLKESTPVGARSSCPTDPVDPASGEMVLEQTDLALPGVLDLVLGRVHVSGYRKGRLFGRTWASSLDQRVQVDEDGIHYLAPDGVVLHYPEPVVHGEKVLPVAGARWPLSWDRASDRIVIEQVESGTRMEFAAGPVPAALRPLASVVDRNGNRVTFVAGPDGVPTDVYHSGGYHVRVSSIDTRDGLRVSALHLVDARGGADELVREFRYDMAGRLVGVVDSSRVAHCFEYDGDDRITAWVNRIGYRYEYEYGPDGRVVRTGGEDGTLAGEITYDDVLRTTTFTSSLGETTIYRIDEHGHVGEVIDPLGHRTLIQQDRFGRTLGVTDPLGESTRVERDNTGAPIRVERPDGTVVAATYNSMGQVSAVVDARKGHWLNEHDERGNLIARTDPDGIQTRYTYTERGALAQIIDAFGNAVMVESNAAGLPIAATDPTGARWVIQRDGRGRVVGVTDPLGAVTAIAYDGEDRRTMRTRPDGSVETWRYDTAGNLVEHVDAAGSVTSLEVGPFGAVTARTDPDGAHYTFTYDRQMRLTQVTNPAGLCWTYRYDAAGNLTSETDFDSRTLTYRRDAAGRLIERVNGADEALTLVRDRLGRVIEQRVGDQSMAHFAYDAEGNLIRAHNQEVDLSFERDRLGRVVAETADGRRLETVYDAGGRPLSRTTPSGRVTTWQYDANGTPVQVISGGHEIAFGHDAARRETHRWISPTTAITQEWDALDRITARRVIAVEGVGEQRIGRLLQERSWTYRADDLPVSVNDSSDGVARFDLDPLGRITAVNGATWSEAYAYDACGNTVHASDTRQPDGAALGPRTVTGTLVRQAGRTRYVYDDQGRLTRKVRRTLSGAEKAWTYSYDALDRMTEATTPLGERWRYHYDPLGRRIRKQRIDGDGRPVQDYRFTWDGAVLSEQEHEHSDGRYATVTSWDYEPGSHTPITQDTRTFYTEAPQNVVDRQFHAIVTDLVGTPTELATTDGEIVWRRKAAVWGPAVGEADDGGIGCPLRFPGQYHDAERAVSAVMSDMGLLESVVPGRIG
jgi:YD repeat-containing protein